MINSHAEQMDETLKHSVDGQSFADQEVRVEAQLEESMVINGELFLTGLLFWRLGWREIPILKLEIAFPWHTTRT